jgi:hypothetical protein
MRKVPNMLTSSVPSPLFRAAPVDDMSPWVRGLSCWLIAGVAALVCVPELRGSDPLVGWLPFWLIVAPGIDLAVLRRRSLIARTRELLARFSRRRSRPMRQAAPLRRRSRNTRHAQPLARKARQGTAAPGISASR